MTSQEQLKDKIDRILSECTEILSAFEASMSEPPKNIFRQMKEIEATILRFKRQGIRIPSELKQAKLRLIGDFDKQKDLSSLFEYFAKELHSLLSQDIFKKHMVSSPPTKGSKNKKNRKPSDYQRPLGSKGNTNLEDYLIPVINLMNKGYTHVQAFHSVKDKLDVRYQTVSAQCTLALGLTTEEFISNVKSGKIINILETKFPDQYQLIKTELTTS